MPNKWYVMRGGNRKGPMTISQLNELAKSGALQQDDLVANSGKEWSFAWQVPELSFGAAEKRVENQSLPVRSESFRRTENSPYVEMLFQLLRSYRLFKGQRMLVALLDSVALMDISARPDVRELERLDPLPAAFNRKMYEYQSGFGRGELEVVFHGEKLVNIRAQIWPSDPRKCLIDVVVPNLKAVLGAPIEESTSQSLFREWGLVVVAREIVGAVSTYIIDENYA